MTSLVALRTVIVCGLVLSARCTRGSRPEAAVAAQYELRGEGCRRTLTRSGEKVCDAVVVPRGKKPCEQVGSAAPGADGEPQIEQQFGSGCEGTSTLAGPMGKELFFVEMEEGGFIVLCDGARVDHIDEFAEARSQCVGARPK